MKPFRVIVPEPLAFSPPDEKTETESCHATRAEAERRCREIVMEELQRCFDETQSWTKALTEYRDSGREAYVQSEGEAVAFFSDFARDWVSERLVEDWPALMDRIADTKPETPRGWFRWLHHSFLSRNQAGVKLAISEEWRAVERVTVSKPERLDDLLMLNIEAHAWEIGWLGLRRLAESCWGRLSARSKGLLLAGYSNLRKASEWIRSRLPEAELSAESVLELACNAVWHRDFDLFQAAMERGHLSDEVERIEPFDWGPSRECRFAGNVVRLSDRVVDMALEASVLRGWAEGARLALRLGANPDLHMWALERSYSEHHSALSYAIKAGSTDVVEALLGAGAGPSNESDSQSLCLAIMGRNDALAARLIESGVGFERGDKPDWLAASRPGDNIERERSIFFNCHREDIEQARRLGEGLPLLHASEAAWFYRGNSQGGRYRTILSHFLYHDDSERLRWYVDKGLPLKLTLPDFATLLSWGAYDCLRWMMSRWNVPPRVMWRIRRELPDFGTGRRLWRVRPDARRAGILPDFDPGDQEPLELPDGGRLWVDLSGLAGGDHQLGPATPGTLWVRTCKVTARRRADRVVLLEARQTWELLPEPGNDYQLRDMLPVVKEVDGVFLATGLSMGKVWWQDYPAGGDAKDWIEQWSEGATWERLRPRVIERLHAQRAANVELPAPVLSDGEPSLTQASSGPSCGG